MQREICTSLSFWEPESQRLRIPRDVKEKLCYIASDYDSKPTSTAESSDNDTAYELPDGNILTDATKRFRYAEALFQPSFHPAESTSLSSQMETSQLSALEILPLRGSVVPAKFQALQSVCYKTRLMDACVSELAGQRREGSIVSCQLKVFRFCSGTPLCVVQEPFWSYVHLRLGTVQNYGYCELVVRESLRSSTECPSFHSWMCR